MDFHGSNILELVKAKDDRLWISNPFGRNPENNEDGRDGIILEFDRPKDSNLVKVAFNVQNTPWSSYLMRQFRWIKYGKRRNADQKMVKQIRRLTGRDTAAIMDYTSRLRPPEDKLAKPGWVNPDFPKYIRRPGHY